jgi:hypothetical protein
MQLSGPPIKPVCIFTGRGAQSYAGTGGNGAVASASVNPRSQRMVPA